MAFRDDKDALVEWQPGAYGIERAEANCPVCDSVCFVSYLLPGTLSVMRIGDEEVENCGYYCAECEWGNAGARRVKEDVD